MVQICLILITAFTAAVFDPPLPLFHELFLADRWCEGQRVHNRLKTDILVVKHVVQIFRKPELILIISGVAGVVYVAWNCCD